MGNEKSLSHFPMMIFAMDKFSIQAPCFLLFSFSHS
jgi:hypothetical protein